MTELDSYTDQIRAELSAMTVKELRQYAREHQVPLGGESTKRGMLTEMVGQLRHRKSIEIEGRGGAR